MILFRVIPCGVLLSVNGNVCATGEADGAGESDELELRSGSDVAVQAVIKHTLETSRR